MGGRVKLSSVDVVPLGLGTGGVRLVPSAFPAVGAAPLGFEAGAGFRDVAALHEQGDDLGVVGFASCREMGCKTMQNKAGPDGYARARFMQSDGCAVLVAAPAGVPRAS